MTDEKDTQIDDTPATEAPHEHKHGDHDHDHDEEGEFSFVEDPVFDIQYKGDCAYEVAVTIPVANISEKSRELFDELKREAEVPGFRRGRAPRNLIEKKFSKTVRGEVESQLIGAAFKKLIKDTELAPLDMPDTEGLEALKDRPADEPMKFTLKFEVVPKVTLKDYKGVAVERPVVAVTDDMIDKAVEDLRERYAVFEAVPDAVAESGDHLVLDFEGTVEGKAFPGGSAKNYPYILGTKRFFPEFEEVLAGAKPGAKLSCSVTMPDNTPNDAIRGKKADFSIQIKEIRRRQKPEVDDAFAKQARFDSVADMREKLAESMKESLAERCWSIAADRALDTIVAQAEFELPQSMRKSIADGIFESEVAELRSRRVNAQEIEKHEPEMRKRADEQADLEIKRTVILNEIGRLENLEVTEEDFDREVDSIARRAGVDSDTVVNYMDKESNRSRTEGRLFRAKAREFIMEHAVVTNKETPLDELLNAEAEAQEDDASEDDE